MHEMTMLPSIR